MPGSPFWLKQGGDEVRPCVPFKAVPAGAELIPARKAIIGAVSGGQRERGFGDVGLII